MNKFEKVSRFAEIDLPMPVRATSGAAGYDLVVAEDTVVPSFWNYFAEWADECAIDGTFTLDEVAAEMKRLKTKPTLVSTGVKCQLDDGYYLELTVRSSTPLKYWLILANSEGIIDADYYNNPSNEGEIFLQFINFSPVDIILKRGDKIGQGIIKRYYCAIDDKTTGERTGGFGSTSAQPSVAVNALPMAKDNATGVAVDSMVYQHNTQAPTLDSLESVKKELEKQWSKLGYYGGRL